MTAAQIAQKIKAEPIPVQVGVHEEQMWFDDESAGRKVSVKATQVIDNNDYVDVDRLQGYNPLDEQQVVEEQTEQTGAVQAEQVTKTESWANVVPLDIEPFEYLIICYGKPIVLSHSLQVIEATIEELIVDKNIPPNDIILCKRLQIDFGVKINEI
jgi:hypothetical protein